MKNNIKKLLDIRDMSINELSEKINHTYANTHSLVNRESLGSTPLETLIKVANVLDVDVRLLYTDNDKELELLDLFGKNYAGGLSALALKNYKNNIEKKSKAKAK